MEAKEVFARNLSNLLQSTDRTQAELAAYVNVAPPTITDWKKGRKMPRMDRIERIAKFFHVSTDLLLGNTDAQKNDGLPDLNARDERQIERDLEDMMHSVSTAAYEGDTDAQEDVEAFKATLRAAMIQAKRIAKKKYTPRKYQQ